MYLFTAFVLIAIAVLAANLVRLFACTRGTWRRTTDTTERVKAAILFLLYFIITGVFVWCACASLCDIYCPIIEVLSQK